MSLPPLTSFFVRFLPSKEVIIIEHEEKQIFYPTNDYIFRRIFGTVGNENITKDFLSSIIPDKINSISLSNNVELTPNNINDKYGILDVKAVLNNKISCDIEMQVSNNIWMTSRALFYWSKLYNEQLKKGDDYSELNKTIIILILNYDDNISSLIPKVCTTWHIREDDFPDKLLTNLLEFHIINLPKLQKLSVNKDINNKTIANYQDFDKRNSLISWLRFVINPNNLEVNDMSNENIQNAKKEFNKIQEDEKEREIAFQRQIYLMDKKASEMTGYNKGFSKGEEKGRTEGKAEGEKEKTIEIARKMKSSNKPIEEIIEFTGLTKEEIEKL